MTFRRRGESALHGDSILGDRSSKPLLTLRHRHVLDQCAWLLNDRIARVSRGDTCTRADAEADNEHFDGKTTE